MKNTAQLASGGEKWSNACPREAAISTARTVRVSRREEVAVMGVGRQRANPDSSPSPARQSARVS